MQQTNQLTESEIIARILQGEKPLYEILVRRFNADLYKIGRSYNYNHEDTQDLMQDTYLEAFRSLSKFEQRSGFKTWLIRIMLNHCYHKKQKLSFKNEYSGLAINENAKPIYAMANNDGAKHIQNRELERLIEESLSKIPEDYRIVFALREMTGLNVAEAASVLEISEANVKVRLNRAKSMLRHEIEKSYSSEELFSFNLVYCNSFTEELMAKISEL